MYYASENVKKSLKLCYRNSTDPTNLIWIRAKWKQVQPKMEQIKHNAVKIFYPLFYALCSNIKLSVIVHNYTSGLSFDYMCPVIKCAILKQATRPDKKG